MEFEEERVDGAIALTVRGRIDSATAPLLAEKLGAVLAGPSATLVVDLQGTDYISSAGFRVLLVAAKRAEETGARLVLCGLSSRVRQLFELGGFQDLFAIAPTREDAVKAPG